MSKIRFLIPVFISIFIIFMSSCNRHVRYIYVKDQKVDSVYSYGIKSEKYRIKPGDILDVKIITTEEKINQLFEAGKKNNVSNQSQNGSNFYLTGFTVSDSGYVKIPVIGMLKASGKTVAEFRKELEKNTYDYLKNAIVTVKLVSFKISFLGEVNNKGTFYVFQDNIDVLEAISRAGGVTEYADMKNVTVIRQKENNREVYKLDLTDRKLLTSEKFYLYPDDIVIIDPVKAKIAKMNLQDYFFFFSAFSSALSTTALILSILGNR